MDAKRLAVGTLAGALTLSATGYVVFGMVFPDVFTNFMNAGSATGEVVPGAIAGGVIAFVLGKSGRALPRAGRR